MVSPSSSFFAAPAPKVIALVGMMGAGKSVVGKCLAQCLNIDFVDTDQEIETEQGISISNIFASKGEAAFRKLEREMIEKLVRKDRTVLATGGGAFVDLQTRTLLKDKSISIWLSTDLDVLVERVSKRSHRPLIHNKNPRIVLSDLLAKRELYYREADITVTNNDELVGETVKRVIKAIDLWIKNLKGV